MIEHLLSIHCRLHALGFTVASAAGNGNKYFIVSDSHWPFFRAANILYMKQEENA